MIMRLAESVSYIHHSQSSNIGKDIVRISHLPCNVRFGETSWLARKIVLGEEVQALCYQPSMEVYVLGTCRKIDFVLPDDVDFHHEWRSEGKLLSGTTVSVILDANFLLPRNLPEATNRSRSNQAFEPYQLEYRRHVRLFIS